MSEEWTGWREGMLCVCVGGFSPPPPKGYVYPTNVKYLGINEIFTVRTVEFDTISQELALRLEEVTNDFVWTGQRHVETQYYAKNFRPLLGTETGMSMLEQVRIKASEPATENV